jgi:hypothetical protein
MNDMQDLLNKAVRWDAATTLKAREIIDGRLRELARAHNDLGLHPLPKSHGGLHHVTCDYCPVKFGCSCPNPSGPHMCMGCDTKAEESKMPEPMTADEYRAQTESE